MRSTTFIALCLQILDGMLKMPSEHISNSLGIYLFDLYIFCTLFPGRCRLEKVATSLGFLTRGEK